MSHRLIRGATSREMDVVAKLTTAGERADSPSVKAALGEGLALIAELIAERGRRHDFDDQVDEPPDDVQWDAPCPDE